MGKKVKNVGTKTANLEKYSQEMDVMANEFGSAIAKKDKEKAKEVIQKRDERQMEALEELSKNKSSVLEVFPYKTRATKDFSEESVKEAFSVAKVRYNKHKKATAEQNADIEKGSSNEDLSDDAVIDLVTSQVSLARKNLVELDRTKKIAWDDPSDDFWKPNSADSQYARWSIVSKDPKVLKAIAKQGLVPKDDRVLREEIDRLYEFISLKSDYSKEKYIFPQPLLDSYIEYRIILLDINSDET